MTTIAATMIPFLIGSVLFLAAPVYFACLRKNLRDAFLASLPLVFVFLFLSPALFGQVLLTWLIALGCWLLGARPAVFAVGVLIAMAIGYAVPIREGAARVALLQSLRREFPIESVAHRLAYELPKQESFSAHVDQASFQLPAAVEKRLNDFEERETPDYRSPALARLHDQTRDEFIRASGFGVTRMGPVVFGRYIAVRNPPPVPQPDTLPRERPEPLDGTPDPLEPAINPDAVELLAMHEEGLFDFLDPERMGYVESRDHVVGFEPHLFKQVPRLKIGEDESLSQWRVDRLELVSLLKYETPAVYVSENLPRMDELADAPTRPLDAFERESLPSLFAEEDLVILEHEDQIRMLGSIRAAQDCLSCHTAVRGELLGAFSYRLVRKTPTQEASQSPPPVPEL